MKVLISTIVFCFAVSDFAFSQNEIAPYPDNSLTTEAYVYIGVPDPSSPWLSKDYKKGFRFLERIFELDKWSLPRKDSPYSGEVFGRMVAKENLDILVDKSIPLPQRLEEIDGLARYTASVRLLYEEPDQPHERFSKEVLAAKGFELYFGKNALMLIMELSDLLPESQRTDPDFVKATQGIKDNLSDATRDWIALIDTQRNRYNRIDIYSYFEEVSETTLIVWSYLPKADQTDILNRLEKVAKSLTDKELRQEFKLLIKKLKA